jgi:putative transcriptional regulator
MASRVPDPKTNRGHLEGHFLIAMPGMADERFARSVVYMCAHSTDGAMGIRINQAASKVTFRSLLAQLNVIPEGQEIQLPNAADHMQVFHGGPVETSRGFVLHSSDYFIENSTLVIDEHVCLTATLEILKAIATGVGPANSMLALGYAGWAPGQIESEIQANGWLSCRVEPDLIFDPNIDSKYDRALGLLGVDPTRLASDVGHA